MAYRFKTENFLTQNQFRVELPKGNTKAIYLNFEFTNQAGQALSQAELGFVKLLSPDGATLWNVNIQRLYGFVDRMYPGNQRSNTPVGAAGEHFIMIPMYMPKDDNIVRFSNGYILEFQHNDLSVDISAGTLTIYIQTGLGFQRYFPLYNNYEIKTDSAEVTPHNFPRKNLAYVTITPNNNVSNVAFTKDGNYLYNETDEVIDRSTNMLSEQKSWTVGSDDTSPWILSLYNEKNLTEVLGQNYGLTVVNGTDVSATGMDVQLMLTEAALDVTSQVLASVKDKNATTPAEKIVA